MQRSFLVDFSRSSEPLLLFSPQPHSHTLCVCVSCITNYRGHCCGATVLRRSTRRSHIYQGEVGEKMVRLISRLLSPYASLFFPLPPSQPSLLHWAVHCHIVGTVRGGGGLRGIWRQKAIPTTKMYTGPVCPGQRGHWLFLTFDFWRLFILNF